MIGVDCVQKTLTLRGKSQITLSTWKIVGIRKFVQRFGDSSKLSKKVMEKVKAKGQKNF